MNIWDAIEKLNKVKQDKQAWFKQRRLQAGQSARVEDLVRKFHQVGKISLPYPTVFADDMIKSYFGDYDKINLNENKHLAALVFFLRNGGTAEIASLPKPELEARIDATMAEIRLDERDDYIYCISDLYLALKKKSVLDQKAVLLNFARTMGLAVDGANA